MSHKRNASSTHKNKRAIVNVSRKQKTPKVVTRRYVESVIRDALADDVRVAVRLANIRVR